MSGDIERLMRPESAPLAVENLHRLDGKVAIVTGASSGLGERFARVLVRAGATVVVAARRDDRLLALAKELGPLAHPRRCDVAQGQDRVDLVASTVAALGSVDILVNNAGMARFGPAEDEPVEQFCEVLETNLVAVFHLAQLAAREMIGRGGGAIVNVASAFGLVAGAPIKCASYCASKGGVVNLTRELGAQWASRGVRVNAIAPSFFTTEMSSAVWDDERTLAFYEKETPARRGGTESELDGVLLLLAGPGGSYIIGQTIAVDGGWTSR